MSLCFTVRLIKSVILKKKLYYQKINYRSHDYFSTKIIGLKKICGWKLILPWGLSDFDFKRLKKQDCNLSQTTNAYKTVGEI